MIAEGNLGDFVVSVDWEGDNGRFLKFTSGGDMSDASSVFCLLVSAADEDGRIEFTSFSDLKVDIGYLGSAQSLRRHIESLYQVPSDQRRVHFKSRQRRLLDSEDNGSKNKILIIVPGNEVVLQKLQDGGPVSLPVDQDSSEAYDRVFGLRGSNGVIRRLIRTGLVKNQHTKGSRGKVYETISLA